MRPWIFCESGTLYIYTVCNIEDIKSVVHACIYRKHLLYTESSTELRSIHITITVCIPALLLIYIMLHLLGIIVSSNIHTASTLRLAPEVQREVCRGQLQSQSQVLQMITQLQSVSSNLH